MVRIPRVPLESIRAGELRLAGDAARYVSRVHRLSAGDRFVGFDPAAAVEASVTVVSTSKREVLCRADAPVSAPRVATRPVTLLQAVGKGDKPDQVIRDATALGATRIVLVETERVVPSVRDRHAGRGERYRRVALDAARQSGRGNLPELGGPSPLSQVLAEDNPGAYLLQPGSPRFLSTALLEERPPSVTLLIGPEGGFSPIELDAIDRAGFRRVTLGPLVLRTETAAVAALAIATAAGFSP